MDTKWKKWKGALSFTAFFLAVNFLVAGAFLLAMLPLGGLSVRDVAQSDDQNTQAFRDLISDELDALIAMAEGTSDEIDLPLWGGVTSVSRGTALSVLTPDKNLLFQTGGHRGAGRYGNGLTGGSRHDLPAGYNFYLRYYGGRLSIWKDGEAVDVYRSGSGWRIPVKNEKSVTVTLAVAASPAQYAVPGGGSPLYGLSRDLSVGRTRLVLGGALAAAGLALLVLSMAWRAEGRALCAAIAVGTGKIWFEVKLLALLPVAYGALVVFAPSGLRILWGTLVDFARNIDRNLELALMAALFFYTLWLLYLLVGDLRHNRAPWRRGLVAKLCAGRSGSGGATLGPRLAGWTGRVWIEVKILLLLLSPKLIFSATVANFIYRLFAMLNLGWVASVYVLLRVPLLVVVIALFVNDLRCNCGQFSRGMVAYFHKALRAGEEKYTIRARLTRRAWASLVCALPFLAVGCLALGWLVYQHFTLLNLAAALVLLSLLALLVRLFLRSLSVARDVGVLAEQITAVRAGELGRDFSLPEDADLRDLCAALGDIQSGMREAMDEQLRSERMRVELITNVSHDLKTPLTSVVSYAQLLSEEENLPDHVKDYITILNDKARRLTDMVQDVFEVSKAASGELSLRVERLDFGKLLRQTLADMSDPIAQSGLVFRTDLPAEAVYIRADGNRLYRVFQNLIQNALQYSLPASRVHIILRVEEGVAVAEIKNTSRAELRAGTDFTARFTRGDESRTGEGSGLGLAIASSFTASCGGTFAVNTDADLFTACAAFPLA